MTPKERAIDIINIVEAAAWSDDYKMHKLIPIVTDFIKKAILEERESCAKVCEAITEQHQPSFEKVQSEEWLSTKCAHAIRARGRRNCTCGTGVDWAHEPG